MFCTTLKSIKYLPLPCGRGSWNVLAALIIFGCAQTFGAQFTPGNIAVVRVGGDANNNAGAAVLTPITAPVFIDEFTPAGTYVQTFALPTAASGANFPLTISGSINAEGLLHLSVNKNFLTMVGYAAAAGEPPPSEVLAQEVRRTVAVIGFDGSIDTTTALLDFANRNNARAAVSLDGKQVWLCGADEFVGGVRYISALGGTNSIDLTSAPFKNCRDIAIYNGQLYFSQVRRDSGSIVEALGTGLPTGGAPPVFDLPGGDVNPSLNGAPNGFFFARLGAGFAYNGFDTLYVADGASTVQDAVPGITKYTYDGFNWVNSGTIGTAGESYSGLIGTVSEGTVTLYAQRPGSINQIVDSTGFGGVLSATPLRIVRAPVNTAFRGIAFTPVSPATHVAPAISSFGLDFSYFVNGAPSATVPIAPSGTITANAPNFIGGSLTVSFTVNGQPEDQLKLLSAGQVQVTGSAVSFLGAAIGTVSGGVNGAPLIVNFTSENATSGAVQAVLRNVAYHNSAVPAEESLAVRTVQAILNDGAPTDNLSAPVSLRISFVSNSNRPPDITIPGPKTVREDTLLSIAGISIADLDAGGSPIVMTLSAAHGTLSVQAPIQNGVTLANIQGNYSKQVTLTGTEIELTVTLAANVTYIGDPDFNGSDALTISANDQGATGAGGPQTGVRTLPITVTPVNDPPTPVADTVSVFRNSSQNLLDVLANDKDIDSPLLAITDVTLPAHGTIAIVNGKVRYTPNPGFMGTDTFTYAISDGNLPGIQVVDITPPFNPLTLDNGLTYFDNGFELAIPHEGGFGSALCPVPGVPNEFYMTHDRGISLPVPNGTIFPIKAYQPTIFRVRVNADGSATIVSRLPLTNENGAPLNCLPNADNPTGEQVLDINNDPIDVSDNRDGFSQEGIVALADGTFWISDEYGPFLTHFDATGRIIERLKPLAGTGHKLPNVLRNRVPNRSMEGLCVTPDGTKLVACMQTALFNNGSTNIPDLSGPNNNNAQKTAALRVVVYTLATGAIQEYIYLLDQPAYEAAVSEIVALSDTEFLVDERDSKFSSEPSKRKALWRISLVGATDVHDPADSVNGLLYQPGLFGPLAFGQSIEQLTFNKTRAHATAALASVGVTPVAVSPAADYDLLQFSQFNHDKMEGLAVINGGKTIVVSNDDNNGVISGRDVNSIPAFVTNYLPGTRKIDGSQLLFINQYQTVTVNVVNRPPVASDFNFAAKKNTSSAGVLLAADSDGDVLTFALVAGAAHGTATITDATTGAFTYVPSEGFSGTDSFTFKASDNLTDSNIATVTITVPNTPTITSGPTATPSPANAGDVVLFTGAADLGADLVWDFGDGSIAIGPSVTHYYQVPGAYTVTLKAVIGNLIETKTLVLVVNEFGTGVVPTKLQPPRVTIVLNFTVPEANSDGMKLTGRVAIPANFNPAGQHVSIRVGDLVRSYTLDGFGSSANGEFKLTVKSRKGVVKKQNAPFTLTLPPGNIKPAFTNSGLVESAPKGRYSVVVDVVVGSASYKALKTLSFRKSGTVGTAK